MSTIHVAYVGMTHLGINSAVACAARGVKVTCFDPNEVLVQDLRLHVPPVIEPQLVDYMESYRERLSYTSDVNKLNTCDLVIIAPDVPTDDNGNSDLGVLRALISLVDQTISSHIPLVVLSQIPPGFSQSLSLSSERPYYCQVETLIFGQAVERALNPERILFGCANPEAEVSSSYAQFLALFDCPLLPMKYESAELAKIAINCCLVSSISVANTLSELCEHIGADWGEIVPALKLDKRIGPYAYLAPGLGIAGGNLERDLRTVTQYAARHGTDAKVVEAWVCNSEYRRDWVLRLLHEKVLTDVACPRIAIWGLAYKQDTHSTKNSPALALIDHLDQWELMVYDPVVPSSAVSRRQLSQYEGATEVCKGADVLIIMTPWQQFKEHCLSEILSEMRGNYVIDPYGVFQPDTQDEDVRYYRLGQPII